jgi:tetratricopeptide (TPR) repeat protein
MDVGREPLSNPQRLAALRTALALLEGGDTRRAECICRDQLGRNPDDVELLLLLALSIGARGEAEVAAPILNRIARARAGYAHPCDDLARMPVARNQPEHVEQQYRACLHLTPRDKRLCFGLARFLRERGDGEAAAEVLTPMLAAEPKDAEANYEMGQALAEVGRFEQALRHFRQATECDPAQPAFWANLGMMLKVMGQFDPALAAYDHALALAPNDRQIRVNRAVARLHAGRFAEAWQDKDWVLTEPGRTALPSDRLLPPFSRLPGLAGCTLLVVQEEGLGDTLQFVRYLPLLAERGARIVAAVPQTLTRLLRSVPGIAEVPDGDAPVPEYDFYCSFNGLPRAFDTTLDTIPSKVPYLTANPSLAQVWAARLPHKPAFRIGLCWAGQARPWLDGFIGLDRRRSTNLATLAPLAAVPGVCFVSLQKGPAAGQIGAAGFDVFDPMAEVADFADTAAIVANLDLVVSVDTSVVHLAGAMGKPGFLLDRYDNCWRWLSGRDDSPWYPTLRIFRQRQSGEWAPVIERVATALAAMVAHPSRGRECCDAA